MRYILLGASVVIFAVGCARQVTYEIDFAQVEGFDWDGKLRVTKASTYRLGPFLTMEEHRDVRQIQFTSSDGRVASIDPDGYADVPIAVVGVDARLGTHILGTSSIFHSGSPVVVVDLGAFQELSDSTVETDSDAAQESEAVSVQWRSVPSTLKPYAENVDELTLVDWWAIAMQEAEHVAVDYLVPHEGLRITVQGDPRKYGPAILEVRTPDGRLLKRFEEEQVPVHKLKPGAE